MISFCIKNTLYKLVFLLRSFFVKREKSFLVVFLLILFSLAVSFNYLTTPAFLNGFANLGLSFIHGHTYLLQHDPGNVDLIFFNNHVYWPLAPLPAIFFIPVVIFTKSLFSQTVFAVLINFIVALLVYLFSRRVFVFSVINSLWLVILYLFSSVYFNVVFISGSYYFSHGVATALILGALLEHFTKKRYFLIGILMGLLFLTRSMAIIVSVFFVLEIISSNKIIKEKIITLIKLFIPIGVCVLLFFIYNYIRFGDFLNFGYTLTFAYQTKSVVLHPYGMFDIRYFFTNFYYYFLESVLPVLKEMPLGEPVYLLKFPYIQKYLYGSLSFFLVSPIFLLLYKIPWKNIVVRNLMIPSLLIIMMLLCYYYNGFPQIGPRYMNDTLPLLFVALLFVLKTSFNYKHKIIILLSIFLNIFIMIFGFSAFLLFET